MMQDWLDQLLHRIVAIAVVMKARQIRGQQGKRSIKGIMATQHEVSIPVPYYNLQLLQRYNQKMSARSPTALL